MFIVFEGCFSDFSYLKVIDKIAKSKEFGKKIVHF
jgi:hypothetical protein